MASTASAPIVTDSRVTTGWPGAAVPGVPFAAVDVTNRNTALASALVEELARCGLRRAVVAPGSRSTPLAIALWRQPAIEVAEHRAAARQHHATIVDIDAQFWRDPFE